MRAYELYGIGDLRMVEREKPSLKEDQALVRVKAAGICGSDIPRIYKNGTYHFPTVPGHEFSGVVERTGSGAQAGLRGKRVGVFPLIPCRSCGNCVAEDYELCRNYDYLGSRSDGGFSQYVAVPVWNLIELPDEVSFETGAMLEPAAVARHALTRLALERAHSLAIWGAGPVGLLMAQWARILGVERVFLIVNKPEQKEMALRVGIRDCCLNGSENAQEWLLERTEGTGPDAAVEGTGRPEALEDCLRCVRPKGQILAVGNPAGDMTLTRDAYWQVLRKQLRICGTWNSRFKTSGEDDWKETILALAEGRLEAEPLITHLLPFDRLEQGLLMMRDKTEYFCKVMIKDQDCEYE